MDYIKYLTQINYLQYDNIKINVRYICDFTYWELILNL